jgi:F-type H+-transporting ATPase subunit gamma
MATLRVIRRRITSVRKTQQVTRAMKFVAAAKLRRAQQRITNARPYADKMAEVVASLARRTDPARHPLLVARPVRHLLLVPVTSDKGLCGAYNANVLRSTFDLIQSRSEQAEALAVSVVAIGKKGRDLLAYRGMEIEREFIGHFGHVEYVLATEIAAYLIEVFQERRADEVTFIYNKFRSAAQQRVTIEPILPLRLLAPQEETAGVEEEDFLYEPSVDGVLSGLLARHLHTQVFRILLDADASEHGARMVAMGNATNNASDMITDLTRRLNRTRQAAITREIIEVVSGADALRG